MIELIEKNAMRVLSVYSTSPGSRIKRKQIKELTKIPNVVLDKTISKLINLKLLIKKNGLISLNFEHSKIKEVIKIFSDNYSKFKHLPLKEYFMILDIQEEISAIRNLENAYLFGSYAKLTFRSNSDIDIAIISDEINKRDLDNIVKKIERKYSKKLEIHYFGRKFYNNKKDPLVKEILQHGIKII